VVACMGPGTFLLSLPKRALTVVLPKPWRTTPRSEELRAAAWLELLSTVS